jgi:hypothetical protein
MKSSCVVKMNSNNANIIIVPRSSEGDVLKSRVFEASIHFVEETKLQGGKLQTQTIIVSRQKEGDVWKIQVVQSKDSFHGEKRGAMHRIIPKHKNQVFSRHPRTFDTQQDR